MAGRRRERRQLRGLFRGVRRGVRGSDACLRYRTQEPTLALLVVAMYCFVVVINFAMTAGFSALADGERIRTAASSQWRLQLAAEAPIALMAGLTVHVYGTSGLSALAVLAVVQVLFVQIARELHRSTQRAERISELSASRGRLVEQILTAEEGERRRLAEALHDDAMQNSALREPRPRERSERAACRACSDRRRSLN